MKSGADTFGAAGKNESLEGLRAIAIGLVLLYHAGAPGMSSGWLGVDLFFVLSGFLITTLLLREHDRTDRIALGTFWYRRLLRLVPAYCAYAAVVTVLVLRAGPGEFGTHGDGTPADLLVPIWTYTANYMSGGDIWERQYLTRHLWSLALEWQFYMLFPLILVAILRWRWMAVPALLPLLVPALNLVIEFPGPPRWTMTGRGVALFLGSAAAFHLFHFRGVVLPWFLRAHAAAIVLMLASYAALEISAQDEIAGSLAVMFLFWTSAAVIIGNYWYGTDVLGHRLLGIAPLVFVGKISYGIYLWHMLAWEIVWKRIDPAVFADLDRIVAYGGKLALYLGLSAAFAMASYYAVERPFLTLKRRPSGRRDIAVAPS